MGFKLLDWIIVGVFIAGILVIAMLCKRYMKSVADFISANRCGGRYLLCISDGMAGGGAASLVAGFEVAYEAGFATGWWGQFMAPLTMLVAFSGWVIYRFRETRSLSIGQFYEIRYSKRFRLFAGVLTWGAGVINMGIFPAVATRVFIRLCNLPETFMFFGFNLSTYAFLMIVLLVIAIYCVFSGGQITIIVTDFIQGVFVYIVAITVLIVIAYKFNWTMLVDGLKLAPAEESMLNPFHTSKIKNFNLYYYVIAFITSVYGMLAFGGQVSTRTISAKTAHESKMIQIISMWRNVIVGAIIGLIPIGAYAIMHNPEYAGIQESVNQALSVYEGDTTLERQMTVPAVMSVVLPTGILGLFGAMLFAYFLTTNDTYLHSWGTMFVQDVILPFRKKPFTPKQHIRLLRFGVLFVALIIYLFALFYKQNEQIFFFFQITGALIVAGAGSAIVGGLYWKRGSTSGAWLALIIGVTLSAGSMIARHYWVDSIYPWLADYHPQFLEGLKNVLEGISSRMIWINWEVTPGGEFPVSSMWTSLVAIFFAIIAYVTCSLFEWLVLKRPAFNLERMLHRGEYAVYGDHTQGVVKPVTGWRTLIPTKEFTRFDKVLYFAKFGWTISWFAVFIIGSIYNFTHEATDDDWAMYWKVSVIISICLGLVTAVWFSIGGIRDMIYMFRVLGSDKRDARDMGMVIGHRSYEEVPEDEIDSGQDD